MPFVPVIRQILRDSLGPGVPDWVDRLLSPLNQFLKQTADLLSGNLTTENMAQAWVEITLGANEVPDPIGFEKLRGKEVYGLDVKQVRFLPSAPSVPVAIPNEFNAISVAVWEPRQLPGQNGGQVAGVAILKVVGIPVGSRVTLRLLAMAR